MQLYILFHGKSKKRQKKIMIDEKYKCENYMKSREKNGVRGWHSMAIAPTDSIVWKQKTCAIHGRK